MKPGLLLCAVLGIAAGCGKPTEQPPPPPPATPASATVELFGTSVVTGRVIFKGTAPKPAVIQMSADPYCASAHGDTVTSEEVLVNVDGTLRNVFVYIKSGLGDRRFPAPSQPALIDQTGCMYRPHVQGMQVGQPLLIRNNDDTLHNIHSLAEQNAAFNLGQPNKGMVAKRSFTKPEVMVHFKCDVHPWMSAYVGVLDHPYFSVTGENGTFKLENLPAGEYVIEAWHEKFGTQTQTVAVANDETKAIEFVFSK